MAKFKVGDKVRCIDNEGSGDPGLILGQVYTVHYYGEDMVGVEPGRKFGDWYTYRFELVEEPKAPSKFQVGMRVWGADCGWTVVSHVYPNEVYAVVTECGNTYTAEGRRWAEDIYPCLFLDEIKPEAWPNPPAPKPKASELKVGQEIECTHYSSLELVPIYRKRKVVFVAGDDIWVEDMYITNQAHKVKDWRLPTT